MVLAFVWKSPLGGMHLFSYSCHFLFLFKSWHVKIKLSHQNLLFKYKPVHFCTGTGTPSGLVFSRLMQPPKAPFLQQGVPHPSRPASRWQSCSPPGNDKSFSPALYSSLGTRLKANAELFGSCPELPEIMASGGQVRLAFPEQACPRSGLNNLSFPCCLGSLHLSNAYKERGYQETKHN